MISVDGNLLIIDLCLKRRLEIRLVLSGRVLFTEDTPSPRR